VILVLQDEFPDAQPEDGPVMRQCDLRLMDALRHDYQVCDGALFIEVPSDYPGGFWSLMDLVARIAPRWETVRHYGLLMHGYVNWVAQRRGRSMTNHSLDLDGLGARIDHEHVDDEHGSDIFYSLPIEERPLFVRGVVNDIENRFLGLCGDSAAAAFVYVFAYLHQVPLDSDLFSQLAGEALRSESRMVKLVEHSEEEVI
jgi:hypothetical protein